MKHRSTGSAGAMRCAWCDAPGPLWSEPQSGEMLCAECIAAMVDDGVDEREHGGEA